MVFHFFIILLDSWAKTYDLEKLLSERGVFVCQKCPALPRPHTMQQLLHSILKDYDYILEMLKFF